MYCQIFCNAYIFLSEQNSALLRLIKMVRGIGNPLVAWYARCYLCRIGVLTNLSVNYFEESFKDILLTYRQVNYLIILHLNNKNTFIVCIIS